MLLSRMSLGVCVTEILVKLTTIHILSFSELTHLYGSKKLWYLSWFK